MPFGPLAPIVQRCGHHDALQTVLLSPKEAVTPARRISACKEPVTYWAIFVVSLRIL